jgi:hypothetical protein
MQDLGEEFMMFLGMCITEWANVEDEVFEIFHAVLSTDHRRTAILFYNVPTLESRLNLCSELLTTIFPQPVKKNGGHKNADHKAWDKLLAAIKDAMKTRNRLAHSPVAPFLASGQNWLKAIARGEAIRFRLYTPLPKKNRQKHAGEGPIELGDLKVHLATVAELVGQLQRFRLALRAHILKLPQPKPQPSQGHNP